MKKVFFNSGQVLKGVNYVSCSRIQHSDSTGDQTRDLLSLSLMLYQGAIVLP